MLDALSWRRVEYPERAGTSANSSCLALRSQEFNERKIKTVPRLNYFKSCLDISYLTSNAYF